MEFPVPKRAREHATQLVTETGIDVLRALNSHHPHPQNVSELSKETRHMGGVVIEALRVLFRAGLISSSTGNVGRIRASLDISKFSITPEGQEWLRQWRRPRRHR
jgi:DNA-binding PadR family transcriptional regulator